ncbi:arginase [Paenibacillus sp. GD4]|uniref:arginase n=1 Tax=Paenibacillus sp. GD4 TaxID=3068890 RepID=UPI002796DD10|nr:arginase [Paenibacillus sp. GD4]MDQ1910476.1 arginase [Paenibacillus sp. GD4]
MNPGRNRSVTVLGVPMDLGADRRGVDMGPSAIRCAGLEQRLAELGYQVRDEGDLIVRRAKSQPAQGTNLKYLYEIARVNGELCERVSQTVAGQNFPLVIGGDHSIAIGTLAGLSQHYPRLGVIWYDTHGDVNTAETSPSGNIHGMALAVAMGYGHELLTSIGGHMKSPMDPSRVVIIGARSLDPGEKLFLRKLGVKVFTMHEIDRIGMTRVMEQALRIVTNGTDGVHLSLDLDALDPSFAPGVGTPVPGGLSFRESQLAMEMIAEANVLVGAEFVEVNPILDHLNSTAKVAVELVGSLFGETIL